ALYAARRQFGNTTNLKETSMEMWTFASLERIWQDIRYSARMLLKSPGFSVIAVLTLALGIGANTAIFSVVDAILLRPLPYPEPSRLVRIWEWSLKHDSPRNVVNPFNFLDWRDHAQSFEAMAAISDGVTNVSVNGQPLAVDSLQVSPEFFSILRVPPFLGRTFIPDDGLPGHDRVIILGYQFWQHQFGGNGSVIGQKMEVDGLPTTIVGVMPQGFSFPKTRSQVWTPLPIARTEEWRRGRFLTTVARLKPGVSLEQAQQDMLNVARFTAES